MKLTITIESDNVGVSTDHDVAQLVHTVANKIASGGEGGRIKDANGNTVGSWDYERDEDSEDFDEDEEEHADLVSRLTLPECQALLDQAGIQTYDHESIEILREAVRVNVCDGTLSVEDVENVGEIAIDHPDSCPACGGDRIEHLGTLGAKQHYRCKNCGIEFSPND